MPSPTKASIEYGEVPQLQKTDMEQIVVRRKSGFRKYFVKGFILLILVATTVMWGFMASAGQEKKTVKSQAASDTTDPTNSHMDADADTDSGPDEQSDSKNSDAGEPIDTTDIDDAVTSNLTDTENEILHMPNIECITDRVGHFHLVSPGQGLCNQENFFYVSTDGALVLFSNDESYILHQDPLVASFQMTDHGHFQLLDAQNRTIWEASPTISISPTPHCLHKPALDCPYLHLHADGVLVLNSIRSSGWSARNVQRVFPNLFPSN